MSLDDETKPQCCWRAAKVEATRSKASGCRYKGKTKLVERNTIRKFIDVVYVICATCSYMCLTMSMCSFRSYLYMCHRYKYIVVNLLCFKCKPSNLKSNQHLFIKLNLCHKCLLSLCTIDVIHYSLSFFLKGTENGLYHKYFFSSIYQL